MGRYLSQRKYPNVGIAINAAMLRKTFKSVWAFKFLNQFHIIQTTTRSSFTYRFGGGGGGGAAGGTDLPPFFWPGVGEGRGEG